MDANIFETMRLTNKMSLVTIFLHTALDVSSSTLVLVPLWNHFSRARNGSRVGTGSEPAPEPPWPKRGDNLPEDRGQFDDREYSTKRVLLLAPSTIAQSQQIGLLAAWLQANNLTEATLAA